MENEKVIEQLGEIAKQILYINTLDTQNSDSDDFHEVAVWNIKEALLKAYQLGINNNF